MNKLVALHQKNGAILGLRNGVKIPMGYGDEKEIHHAVRKNILLSDYSHFGIAQISGDSAYELLNIIVAGDVSSIRDEQAMYTVILDENGNVVTDLYILCDDERFVLISEWMRGEALCELLRNAWQGREDEISDVEEISALDDQYGILHFEGPYCWELLTEMYGMDVVGLPFLEHMHIDDGILLRSGKHGEFSYKLIAEPDTLADVWERAVEAGEKFDLRVAGLDYQTQVRLENPCWEPEMYSEFTQCPIELQMQWAVRYDKAEFIGQQALTQRLEHGVSQRVVGLYLAEQPEHLLQRGDKIIFNGQEIGAVITAGYSEEVGAYLGRLVLQNSYAYSDIDCYQVRTATGITNVVTAAVPFARNFSFLVNPTEHSYVDTTRPKHLLEQLEWQQRKEEAQAKKAAEESNKDSDK